MKPLIILGACGNAWDVLDIVRAINSQKPTWNLLGFLDDGLARGHATMAHKILGRLEDCNQFPDAYFINCIGSETTYLRRREIVEGLGLPMSRFATLVHPQSNVSPSARLAAGVYVSFGCCVSGNVEIKTNVSIAPGVIIGHDSRIEPYTVMAPGSVVSGYVSIGESCYLGARSVMRQRTKIGAGALVGMGAVVTRDVEEETTVVGVPARPIESSVLQ